MTKQQRAENANRLITAIASCGRYFFSCRNGISQFEVDSRGRIWFLDSDSKARIYTHYRYEWRGFTNGGTMRDLIERLRDYIRTGEQQRLALGPWPKWVCDGDLWGYGADMDIVRTAARDCGIVPSNAN